MKDKIIKKYNDKYRYNGCWYFYLDRDTIQEAMSLYSNIFTKRQNIIYKRNEFRLEYFNKGVDEKLCEVTKEIAKEIMQT